MFILYPVTLLKSVINSRSVFCKFVLLFNIFFVDNHVICKEGQFLLFPFQSVCFLCLHLGILQSVGLPATWLNRSGESSCQFWSGSVQSFTSKYNVSVGFFVDAFIKLMRFYSIPV